ncbi:MAG: STAS/SEC14 domain-containing protein [Bacteroidota bacterium]
MKPYTNVNREKFPLVTITFTGAAATDENFAAYLDQLKENYRPRERFALVFDARKAKLPSFAYQRKQADWVKVNEALIAEYCVGTAYVIPGSLIRGILKAIFRLQKQPCPYVILGSPEEGNAWCQERLRDAGIAYA